MDQGTKGPRDHITRGPADHKARRAAEEAYQGIFLLIRVFLILFLLFVDALFIFFDTYATRVCLGNVLGKKKRAFGSSQLERKTSRESTGAICD